MKVNKVTIIFLEGLPGSGKSTLGNKLISNFPSNNNVYFFDELSQDNPIVFFPFFKYEVNDINFRKYIKDHFKTQWTNFITNNKSNNSINIFDGRLWHNILLPLYSFLSDENELIEFYTTLLKILLGSDPFLIYLDFSDISSFKDNIINKRSKSWIENSLNNLAYLPYFKNRSKTINEWIDFWENWLNIERKLFINTKLPKLKIIDNQNDYEGNFNKINAFLSKVQQSY